MSKVNGHKMSAKPPPLKLGSDCACEAAISEALQLYGARATENISLDKLPDARSKARVLGRKLMDHGDARAYALGRDLVAMGEDRHDGPH
ncbi:MAG: hypothetical protein ACRCWF_02670 [Beijerinckiaceae bacterium]